MVLVRVMEGRVSNHLKVKLVAGNETYEVEQLGTLTPKPVALEELEAGDVGFIVANIKRVADARMGDTVIEVARPAPALPGFEAIKPMVFAGLFPVLADDYEPLRDALGKLQLNDAAFFYEPENSVALGFGFRCGFLGLLHMEIVQERLEREFGLNLITTAPSVRYRITRVTGEVMEVDSPSKFPNPDHQSDDHHQRGFRRRNSAALPGKTGHAEKFRVSVSHARHAHLRIAAERNRAGLLRSPEIHFTRLRFARLSPRGLSRIRPHQTGCAGRG